MSDLNLAPITFDNTSNQIWANIANTYKEDTLYKRKLMQDEIKNRNEIQSNLIPGLDKLGWSNEMKAQNYADIVKQASNYYKENKGKTSADLQNYLNNLISGVTQKDIAIKQVYANVDKQVADLDGKSVNKDQVRHKLLQNKLYDPATGALKTEISQEPEDLDKLLNDNPAFYKIDNVQEQLGKMLKDNQFEVGDSSIKYLKDGKRVISYKQNNTYNKAIQAIDMDPKSPTYGDPVIKRDTDGLLDNKGFDILMSNPNVRAYSILQAKEFRKHYNEATPEQRAIMLNSGALSGEDDVDGMIKKNGGLSKSLDDNPEIDRQIQRAFMTNHLVKTFGSKHGDAESKTINQPLTVKIDQTKNTQTDPNAPVHPLDRMAQIEQGNPDYIDVVSEVGGKKVYDVTSQLSGFKIVNAITGAETPSKVTYSNGKYTVYDQAGKAKIYSKTPLFDQIQASAPGIDYKRDRKIFKDPSKINPNPKREGAGDL